MKSNLDDEAIREEFRSLFRPRYGDEPEVYIYRGQGYISVEVSGDSSMDLSLKKLIRLSVFFGTTNINEETQYSAGGCGTCDYGAVYTLRFSIKPEEKEED